MFDRVKAAIVRFGGLLKSRAGFHAPRTTQAVARDEAPNLRGIRELVGSMYEAFDNRNVRLPPETEIAGETRRIECRAGCNYCCHLQVGVSAAEVVNIAAWLEENRHAELASIRRNVADAQRRVGDMRGARRKAARVMCPLLDENGMCGVYPVRPLSCRAYVSFNVEGCREDWLHPTQNVLVYQSSTLQDISRDFQAQLQPWAAQRHNVPTGGYELINAMHMALNDEHFLPNAARGVVRLDGSELILRQHARRRDQKPT